MSRTLLLLTLLAGVLVATTYGLEVKSSAHRTTTNEVHSSDESHVHLPRMNPCVVDCQTETTQCNEECVFSAANSEEELVCRTGCTKAITQCLTHCSSTLKKEQAATAAARKHQSKKSSIPDTFKPYTPPPRPSADNTGYGPETVENWAGYITVNGSTPTVNRYLWYWFFESRNEPSTDPLVIWLTGGPGCSSLVALFYENGPYQIAEDLSLSLNPYSWNTAANVIWIDQPVNTGYSYADSGDMGVTSEAEIADNLYQFLQGFLAEYPKYSKLPFFIAGESYAGHYVPAFGARIVAGNADPSFPNINLQGLAIGNGLVDPIIQYTQYAPFVNATHVLPEYAVDVMQGGIPGCIAAIGACAQNSSAGMEACLAAFEYCNSAEMVPYQMSGLNPYDTRIKCEVPPLCYNFSLVDDFLAQPAVITALGVGNITWQSCNRLVDLELVYAGDWMLNLASSVQTVLANDIRIVVYSGEYDFICNWYGGNAWTNALQWPGQQGFNTADNTTWTVAGEEAGTSRTYGGFTFTRVKDAGHMVPLNQPQRALDLISRVISGAPFDTPAVESEVLTGSIIGGGAPVRAPIPSAEILANHTQCPSPSTIYEDQATGVVFVGCDGLGVISIEEGTIKTVLGNNYCGEPTYITGNSTGAIFVACQTKNPGSSYVLTGPGWTTVTILTTAHQADVPSFIYVDSSVVNRIYILDVQQIILIDQGVQSVFLNQTECSSPSGFTIINQVVYVTCETEGQPGAPTVLQITLSTSSPKPTVATVTTLATEATCPRPLSLAGQSVQGSAVLYVACSENSTIQITVKGNTPVISTIVSASVCRNPNTVIFDNHRGNLFVLCDMSTVAIEPQMQRSWNVTNNNECPEPSAAFFQQPSTLFITCEEGNVLAIPNANMPPSEVVTVRDTMEAVKETFEEMVESALESLVDSVVEMKKKADCKTRPFSSRTFTSEVGTCPAGEPQCNYSPGKFECCFPGENCIPNVGCRC